MPSFGSPFGMGYGLTQIGAGLAQGLRQGQIEAPVLQRERLQNQELQTQVQGQQAANQALSQASPDEVPQDQQLTPYDNQITRLNAAATSLEKSGQGLQANQIRAQALQLAQQQHAFTVGRAAQLALGPDPNKAIPYLKAAGFGEPTKIEVDPKTGERVFVDPEHPDASIRMSPQDLANIAADPSHLAQSLALQSWYHGRLTQGQERVEQNQQKIEEQAKMNKEKIKNMGDTLLNRLQVAQTNAGGRTGAASIMQAGAMARLQAKPEQALFQALTDQGIPVADANSILERTKHPYDPQHLADSAVVAYMKIHPDAKADELQAFRSAMAGGFAQAQPLLAPAAPAPKKINPGGPDPLDKYRALIGQKTNKPNGFTLPGGYTLNIGPDGIIKEITGPAQ